MARAARVIGTASPANHDYLRSLGAEPVAQTFPMAEVAEAHRVSEDGHVREKLVLLVG